MNNEMQNFLVVGRKADGEAVFYTGRAGQGFVSGNKSEAFRYASIEAAQNRARNLNGGTALHGIRFVAPSPNSDFYTSQQPQ